MLTRQASNTMLLDEHGVTENWLETILLECFSTKSQHPQLVVNKFTVSNGGESSESALSDIIAVSIEAEVNKEKKNFDFVIKLLPIDPFSRYFVMEAEFDLREVKFYTEVVPELQDFQKLRLKNNITPIELPIPNCYLAKHVPYDFSETPPSTPSKIAESIIVLEDLKKKGYHNVNFKTGLNLEQVKSAFKAISKIHALSLAMKVHEQKPLNEKYNFLFQTEKASLSYHQLMERGLPYLINFLEKRADMKNIVEFLNEIRPKTKQLTQALLSSKEPFSLITHTDFWSNNLLFKDDECIILDWQMVTYSRPTNDLALLIITSLPARIRRQHTSHLLDFYWKNLIENSRTLELDIEKELKYNRENLDADYKSSQLLALLLCIGSIDIALKDSEIEERLIAVLHDLYQNRILSLDFINEIW